VGAIQIHRQGYLKQVLASPIELDLPADLALLGRIARTPHVTAVAPRIAFGGMVNAGDRTRVAMFTAIDPERESRVCPDRAGRMTAGRLPGPGDPDGLALSGELAARLGVAVGAPLTVLASDRDGVLNAADVKLTGAVGLPGGPQQETLIALLPLRLAEELLRMPGRATELAVAVDDLAAVEETRSALAGLLGEGFEVSTWRELAPVVEDTRRLDDGIFAIVAVVFYLVVLIGIANLMLMAVLERTREIGVMMAVGARRPRILEMFVAEATLVALGSALAGSLAGEALVWLLSRKGLHLHGGGGGMIHVYPALDPLDVPRVILACALGAGLATLYPAWKASRLRPTEALAHV
jgi:putative ABC transport system permease protein